MTTFHRLLATLPPLEQEAVLDRFKAMTPKGATPKAGAVLTAVVKVLERERQTRRKWTMDQIKRGVANEGVEAEPRKVFNAVAYLARRGRVRQTSYGEYLLLDYGVVVQTDENLGPEPPRCE